jgi:hypothetical protein
MQIKAVMSRDIIYLSIRNEIYTKQGIFPRKTQTADVVDVMHVSL